MHVKELTFTTREIEPTGQDWLLDLSLYVAWDCDRCYMIVEQAHLQTDGITPEELQKSWTKIDYRLYTSLTGYEYDFNNPSD